MGYGPRHEVSSRLRTHSPTNRLGVNADQALAAQAWRRRLESIMGTPATEGNLVQVLRNGVEIFPSMLDAIDASQTTVDLVTFVYWQGEIAERFASTLARAAQRGCRVRVLLDAVGARKVRDELVEEMERAGCDVRWFRPVDDTELGSANHRTHRKLLICDSAVGFTGGVGIADEWDGDARNENEWRDTHLRIEGPAVAGLQAGFIDNWADECDDGFDPSVEHPVSERQPGPTTMSVIRGSAATGASEMWRLMLTLITCAEQRITLATAYFNPDDRLMSALRDAVARGVAVTVLVPGEHADKRFVRFAGEATYSALLDAGIDVRAYSISMMHAKVMTVDGVVATVGSANFNRRSTQFDEEANVILFDPGVVDILDAHLDDDLRSSELIDPADWAERGLLQRAGERLSDVASRWL
jgi:cardiolipin synthase